MIINKRIYPDKWNNKEGADIGYRASYYYLHGKLEEDSGYDCFNVEGKLLSNLLTQNIHLAICPHTDTPCLVFSYFNKDYNRMKGFASYINDLEAIEWILREINLPLYINFSMNKEFVKRNYPETFNLIKTTRNDTN